MEHKTYCVMYLDFWITENSTNKVLDMISRRVPEKLADLKIDASMFIFAAMRENIVVPNILFMFHATPSEETIAIIKKHIYEIIVEKSDVYGEGSIVFVTSDNMLLPYQFIELERAIPPYIH